MPSYTRGKLRDKSVAVKLSDTSYYQFKTKDLATVNNVSGSDLNLLGHIELGDGGTGIPSGAFVFLRANAPKPPRVGKKLSGTQGSISTFCAVPALTSVLRSGWNLLKPARTVSLRITGKTITAIASLSNGALYAFPLNKADFETYGAALGLTTSETITTDAERNKVVAGSSLPKPGKAKLTLTTGADFSTFCSHNAPLTDGFSRISAERLL